MSQTNSQIWACRSKSGYVIRVEGHGTMRESHALKEFLHCCFDQSELSVTVDLSECKFLDSTFLGCLVGLHKRLARPNSNGLTVVASADKIASLLHATRIDSLLNTASVAEDVVGECVPVTIAVQDPSGLGHHIMECHRRLAEIDGPDQIAFRRIADQLAQELTEG